MGKLRVKRHPGIAIQVHRVGLREKTLVYALLALKKLKYPWGRTRVAYIGTTLRGTKRTLESIAKHAPDLLKLHGVKTLDAVILTCGKRQRVKTWEKLERAMIFEFRAIYGDVPRGNTKLRKAQEKDEFDYFNRGRIKSLVKSLG